MAGKTPRDPDTAEFTVTPQDSEPCKSSSASSSRLGLLRIHCALRSFLTISCSYRMLMTVSRGRIYSHFPEETEACGGYNTRH